MEHPQVYIAAPFFNTIQIYRVESIKQILTSLNMSYFSPKDECMFDNISTTPPEEILEMNLVALDNVEFTIVVTDDKDVGTIFEAGYCYAKAIPIVYLWLTGKEEDKFNIMLAASGVVARSFAQLETMIRNYNEVGYFADYNMDGMRFE